MPFRTAAALGLFMALPVAAQDTPAPAAMPAEGQPAMAATIQSPEGASLGTARLMTTPSGMTVVTLDLTGLPPGIRGVHLHETGDCTAPDFESAGGHLAHGKDHGVMADGGPHPGDLPNLHVPEGGVMTVEYFAPGLTAEMVADADGSAIILHEQADDYTSQPSGNAGARIGCGIFAEAG